MCDLSNHTVIIHTRYQDISGFPGRVLPLACVRPLSWHSGEDVLRQSVIYDAMEDTLLQPLPVSNGSCATKHGDPRVIFPNPYPFTMSGTLAHFIPLKRQSAHE